MDAEIVDLTNDGDNGADHERGIVKLQDEEPSDHARTTIKRETDTSRSIPKFQAQQKKSPNPSEEWTGASAVEMGIAWTKVAKPMVDAIIPPIKSKFTPEFNRRIDAAIEAGDFATQPEFLCIVHPGHQSMGTTTLAAAFTGRGIPQRSFQIPGSTKYTQYHKAISIRSLPLKDRDPSLQTSHQCHTNPCIDPEHLNPLTGKDNNFLKPCHLKAL